MCKSIILTDISCFSIKDSVIFYGFLLYKVPQKKEGVRFQTDGESDILLISSTSAWSLSLSNGIQLGFVYLQVTYSCDVDIIIIFIVLLYLPLDIYIPNVYPCSKAAFMKARGLIALFRARSPTRRFT